MAYIQEAANFAAGSNYSAVAMRYKLPQNKGNTSIFLLSDSCEYDIELIKKIPLPHMDYKSIIIPYHFINKVMGKPISLTLSNTEYTNKVRTATEARILPKLENIKYPYPKQIENNIFIPMSDVFSLYNQRLRSLSVDYVRDNIFDIFNQILLNFNYSKQKVLYVDCSRYKIYKGMSMSTYKTDIINSLLTAYILNQKIKNINLTIIFRDVSADYKFDLSRFNQQDIPRLSDMLSKIGQREMIIDDDAVGESIDDIETTTDISIIDEDDDDSVAAEDSVGMDDDSDADNNIKKLQKMYSSVTSSLKTSIHELATKLRNQNNTNSENNDKDTLYDSKALEINAKLLGRINPNTQAISNYKSISDDLSISDKDAPVENEIINNTAKEVSKVAIPVDTEDVMNTTTSVREQNIRANISQLKLKKLDIDSLSSVTDIPVPPAQVPLKITTTNVGALKGSSFAMVSKAYEDKMLDSDIIATFMNLANLPDGFLVENIEVTDISTITSLMHNWRVSLKSKTSGKSSVINIRIPKVVNGRFYNNGIWYNIGKQDFPIPILKINKKKVILTSNYNKISVERYDTRSLVDINAMRKVINTAVTDNGMNKYVKSGSSVNTNARYVSTIEYDEYAKQWFSFINEESKCEIYFNRQKCQQLYSFVSVDENEFCCGMIDQVPVVINTETGLTRKGITITDTILNALPNDLRMSYSKIKPGKVSMYAEITIGIKLPLGVTAAAWEGLSVFLNKSGCKYQYVDKNFDDNRYFIIPFKDKILAIENTITNQLLFNGFYRINTKAYEASAFETTIMTSNSVYVDIFNQLFFKQYSQLTTLVTCYNWFVDAITKDICEHFNIPSDIVGMLIYATKLLADNNFTSESNSALYRIRSTEIIPAIVHYRLAFAISKYNNVLGSKTRSNSIVFNPNEVINELLSVPNVEPMSALNPMVELHARENITKKGFRGVNDDRAYSLDKRTYDESMIGKMAISSPNNKTIGITRQLVADPKIESVRGYTSTNGVDTEFNDLQLASFSELLTPGTVTSDDAIRTSIATSQTSHIVPTNDSQPVLISNGVDEIVPSYLTDEFVVTADEDGEVLEISNGYMIIKYNSGKKKAINVSDRYSFNTSSGFNVNNKLLSNFDVNDKFKKNDILAYHAKFFNKDSTGVVRLNIGPLVKVAFAGLYSTYEDAGIITEEASKRLGTTLTMKQTIKLSAMDDIDHIVKVGDEVEINDPLVVFGLGDTGDKSVDNFLKAFSNDNTSMLDTAKRVIKSDHAGKIVDVRINTVKSMDKLSPSLFDIISDHFEENKQKRKILDKHDKSDSVFKLETLYDRAVEPLKGSTIKGITCDILVEIFIEHDDDSSVGDKLVVYGASKQVTSEKVPEGLEPYAEGSPDEHIGLFVAPDSVLKRMIPSVAKIAPGNMVLLKAKEVIAKIWNE